MSSLRAATSDVLARVRGELTVDVQSAAGNSLLSLSEQAALPDGVIKETAKRIRTHGGTGTRVHADQLVQSASDHITALLGQVNQSSGSGASLVSQDEVKAAANLDRDAGARIARAYELITGRHIDLPSNMPTPDSSGVAFAIQGASTTTGASLSLTANSVTISARTVPLTSGAVTVDLPARRIVAQLAQPSRVRDVVEGLRAAAPDLDLLVTAGTVHEMTIEFFPKNQAHRPANAPVYAHFLSPPPSPGQSDNFVRRIHGTKSFELMPSKWQPTDTVSLLVDNKVYTVAPSASIQDGSAAVYDLKQQLEADAIELDFRDYGNLFKFKIL